MALSTVTAAGTAANTSGGTVVPAGTSAQFGLFTTSGGTSLPVGAHVELRVTTPGNDTTIAYLDASNPVAIVQAPSASAVTVKAVRPALAAANACGVFVNQ